MTVFERSYNCGMLKGEVNLAESQKMKLIKQDSKGRFIPMEDVLDQSNEMAQNLGLVCNCDLCCVEETPIVAGDGLLFRCTINGSSYIPTEAVELNDLIMLLQNKLAYISEKKRASSLPSSPSKNYKRHSFNDHNSNMMSVFKVRSTSESSSPTLPRWRERTWSQSSLNRSPSSPTLKGMPQSIILKCTEKQTLSSQTSLSSLSDGTVESAKSALLKKFSDQLAWVKDNGRDFVALETLKTTSEVFALLFVLAESRSPTLVQLKVNCSETITVSYHFLDNFKQEFMMLKVNDSYLFMAPF